MSGLTRRTVIQAGLGGGLATAWTALSPPPAAAAAPNVVRTSSGSAYGSARTAMTLTFATPAAGNLLLALASVDGSSGAVRPPTGWKVAFQRAGASLSLAAYYKVANGSETSATLTWSTSSLGGSWVVAEYTGIRSDDPLGPVQGPAYSDVPRTTMWLNPPPAEANSIALGLFALDAMDTGTTGAEFRPAAPGWEVVATSYDATRPACPATALTGRGLPLAAGQDLAGGTFRWTRSDQVIGATLQLNTGAAAGAVTSRWVGAVTPTGVTVAARVSNASSVRLTVATDVGLTTGVVFSPPAAPDSNGTVQVRVDGLQPATQHYFALELDGRLVTGRGGSFRTTSTTPGSFTFAFGSCCSSVGAATFSEIRGHDPDLFIHLGDLHYGDIPTNDPAAFRAKYDSALGSAHQGPLYANVPTVYTWSDHDFGANGSNQTSASKPAAQATYRQYVPSYPLPSPTNGIYHSFVYRRIRFVVTDNRSYKSPPANLDDAAKTMLGAEQKAWFKQAVSDATEPVVVWVNENPWISAAKPGVDWWGGYTTERAELADFIATSGKRVAIISGDMHALAADDGSHSPGGIPVFQAAAFNGTSSSKGGPYTLGPFPATAKLAVQQYGVMRVLDTGGAQISLQFTGYKVGGTVVMSFTKTFTL